MKRRGFIFGLLGWLIEEIESNRRFAKDEMGEGDAAEHGWMESEEHTPILPAFWSADGASRRLDFVGFCCWISCVSTEERF